VDFELRIGESSKPLLIEHHFDLTAARKQ